VSARKKLLFFEWANNDFVDGKVEEKKNIVVKNFFLFSKPGNQRCRQGPNDRFP